MKNHIFLPIILFFNTIFCSADPLLVAVLMVKNEAPVMEMTLQPLVDAGIRDFLIYDTGSTDDTIKITQDFFINNSITNFVIESGEWIDFATSRNHALEITEQHFPNATFMLMLDAEWILQGGKDLIECCQTLKNTAGTLFLIKIKGFNIEFGHARLILCRSNICFVGKVHEVTNIEPQAKLPDHIYFQLSPTYEGKEKSKARWLKDCDVLLQELQANPDNPRTAYYLAQTYFCLQDWNNAAKWYEYRSKMKGWDEENFLTVFILAQTYALLGDSEKMITNYLKAFSMRPSRAEPLIRLAEYYYNAESFNLCYLFARHACTIAYPKNDISLIEKEMYNFVRYNLLSATAYAIGDYALGKQATLKAITARPDLEYLYQNLDEYEQMLN